MADPRLLKDVVKRKYGKPVFKLDYLLNDVVKRMKPLRYERLEEREVSEITDCIFPSTSISHTAPSFQYLSRVRRIST